MSGVINRHPYAGCSCTSGAKGADRAAENSGKSEMLVLPVPAPVLLTPAEVAVYLRVRDRRTVRRRLAELGIPVVPMGRGYRVRVVDLERAVAAATRVERAGNHPSRPAGVVLRPGERLWDRAGTMAPLLAARQRVGQPGEQRLGQRPPGQRRGG